jgi:hypothetical protein
MIFSLRKLLDRVKFIILFIVMTYLIFHIMNMLSGWIVPQYRYQEPSGSAVKAFIVQDSAMGISSFGDRLRLFYWYGE